MASQEITRLAGRFNELENNRLEFHARNFSGSALRIIRPKRGWEIPKAVKYEPLPYAGISTEDETRRLYHLRWKVELGDQGFDTQQIESYIEMKYTYLTGRLKP